MHLVANRVFAALCITSVGLLVALFVILASKSDLWDGQLSEATVQSENGYICRRHLGINATQCNMERLWPACRALLTSESFFIISSYYPPVQKIVLTAFPKG
jgi:hypothetical protein